MVRDIGGADHGGEVPFTKWVDEKRSTQGYRPLSPSAGTSAGEPGAALRIRLLGGFRVEVGDRIIVDSEWRLQKSRALVKLLALTPRHRFGRDEVLERLWPEVEPEAALNSLYYALHTARGALVRGAPCGTARSTSLLQLAGGVLALAPSESVSVDVEVFEAAATAAQRSNDPRAYRLAFDLYAGELLPEDRYEDWATRPRERLRDIQLQLLSELARVHQEREEYPEAIGALSRLVSEEPTHEEARASLMRMYAAAGQRQQALRHYARLRTALREELDDEPGATTQRLYAQILTGNAAAETQCTCQRQSIGAPGGLCQAAS
jgi:DNA-binding SARP family transcriptional activator